MTTPASSLDLTAVPPEPVSTIDVMLCDDHTIVMAGLERLVSTFPGIRVVATIEGGAGAVEAVLAHRPHIVLMDLQMPVVDGIEATRQIMAAAPSTGVVILTSFSDRHRIQGALAAGAIGYQLKDATPSELESAIRAAARGEAPLAPKVDYNTGTIGIGVLGCSLGIKENELNLFSVYPNPSNGTLFIKGENDVNVSITDVTGKIVYQKHLNGNNSEIKLNQTNGVYFIKIEDVQSGKSQTGKLILQN